MPCHSKPPCRPSPRWSALALCAVLAGCGLIPHDSKDPLTRQQYKQHIMEIDAAEAVVDPIERCLAYPTPPEFDWSQATMRLLCLDMWQAVTHLPKLKRMIDAKDWPGLETHYAALLQRHYAGDDPEFILYRSFPLHSWGNDAEADRYTTQWLDGAPDSAYAHMARGMVLMDRAMTAGDGGPPGLLASARARAAAHLAEQAERILRRASELEPRLLPAYRERLTAAMLIGDAEAQQRLLDQALAQSPQSYYLRERYMETYVPPWHMPFDWMQPIAEKAAPYLQKNPRLHLLRARAASWKGREYLDLGLDGNALDAYRAGLPSGPDAHMLFTAADIAHREGHHLQAIMYWTQTMRFSRYTHMRALEGRASAWWHLDEGERAYCDYKALLALDATHATALRYVAAYEPRLRAKGIAPAGVCGPGNAHAARLRAIVAGAGRSHGQTEQH